MLDITYFMFCFLYTMEWYNLSLSIQKLLLFIMQGNHHSAVLNFYGTWVPTFENLSTQFKLCWSFFMLMYSTQK
ncbi:hypothetical protein E2986_10853 [Frieseomelitta varia]|uniref:Uncharacterized protein n=1 Tax=Frieseomelitta varia TaxID=561572 RepID=A0A833S446_9HYME|nr:hypothetical protein E2986_10853 [Frieseomelitta varia]